ncbi:MAG: hypothetical protein P4M11_14335 [Candidatus Pacebacteria bacterium]|nr:hypothetical protein [Candidatus Paceibacterota bacterium]
MDEDDYDKSKKEEMKKQLERPALPAMPAESSTRSVAPRARQLFVESILALESERLYFSLHSKTI